MTNQDEQVAAAEQLRNIMSAQGYSGEEIDDAIEALASVEHTQDSDCTLGADACCTSCGVYHGEPCADCGGRGFHKPSCYRVARARLGLR